MWSQPKDSVIAFKARMGATFPLALQGYGTARDYHASNNYIFLIDQNGIIRDTVITASLASYTAIDNAVKSLADKIPALLNTAVLHSISDSPHAVLSAAGNLPAREPCFDLRGRLITVKADRPAFPSAITIKNPSASSLLIRK